MRVRLLGRALAIVLAAVPGWADQVPVHSASVVAPAAATVPVAPFLAERQRSTASQAAQARTAQWQEWCSCYRSLEFRPAAVSHVNPPQCAFEVLCHTAERQTERCTAADQHIIMPCAHLGCGRETHNFA